MFDSSHGVQSLVIMPDESYKALGGVVHQAQLEALLVLKGFSEGVSQAVRGEDALSALLKLAENTLKSNRNRWVCVY